MPLKTILCCLLVGAILGCNHGPEQKATTSTEEATSAPAAKETTQQPIRDDSVGTTSSATKAADTTVVADKSETASEVPGTIETVDDIRQDYVRRVRIYSKKFRATPKEERLAFAKKNYPSPEPYRQKLTDMIEADPFSKQAEKAFEWW